MVLTNIQVLRGIAAMLVIWVHAQVMMTSTLIPPSLRQAGYGGVDLFFVISGFIIVHSTSSSTDWATFAKRRFLRVAPLYYVFTLIAVVICYVRPSVFNLTGIDAAMIVKSLAFVPFEIAKNNIYPVYPLGWTLNYEIFFYALFTPMLLLNNVRLRVAMLCAVLLALVLAGTRIHDPAQQGMIAYFCTRPLILDFAFGMIIAIWPYFPTRTVVPSYALLIAGFAGLVWFGRILPTETVTIFPWSGTTLRYGVPSALIVAGMVGLQSCGRTASNPLLKQLGDASYSLYLSHFLVVLPLEFAASVYLHDDLATLAAGMIAMITALAFGVLVYRSVERPLAGDFRFVRRARPIASQQPS
ncbi:acyltransferase [Bradyrhizobium sp. 1]|uniref:acyltransferase family protein n=1 Tax=Bradyrhizobium sp. 1 TaxID=241591 RepID=UPI001FFA64EF|nr:acyltransferase [Bradyrhizobium sp. 1]MCK1396147.1 acyltransferase [Bradyrhizobium sp. 1]